MRCYGVAASQACRFVWAGAASPVRSSARISRIVPVRSATTLCWWIVSRLTWRARHERVFVERGELVDHPRDHFAHAVLDEPRPAVRLLHDVALVRALHELIDLRRHRLLDDPHERGGVDLLLAQLGAADVEGAQAALVVGGNGDRLEDPLDLLGAEALGLEPLARAGGDEALGARARGHALGGHAGEPAGAELGGHGDPVQRVELLSGDARDRRGLVLGEAGLDGDLGAAGVLALAHELGDVLGQGLGAEGLLAKHDLADGVVDDLLEARHVRALLIGPELDHALEARGEELLGAVLSQPDHLLDRCDADAGQAERQCG